MSKRWTCYPGDEHFRDHAIGAYGRDAWVVALEYCNGRRTFMDVGAHIGHYTYNAMGKFKRIMAFEPILLNFACLRDNVKARAKRMKRPPKVDLVAVAVGNENVGAGKLYAVDPSAGKNSGAHEIHIWPDADGKLLEGVPMITLDSLIDGCGTVDLIKIDTQGWEWRVIQGGRELIKRDKPVLIVEVVMNDKLDKKLILGIEDEFGYSFRAQVQKNAVFSKQ